MFRTRAGSTARLIQLCAGYFGFYVATGLLVKLFTQTYSNTSLLRDLFGPAAPAAPPAMGSMAFLAYNTLGANLTCLIPVLILGWWQIKTVRPVRLGGTEIPSELLYIIPSGICTAVVIPTTTLMYTLPISVMVAMVIMRASVIVIGRLVDAIQIRQGILHKRVYWEENAAVVFAVLAASIEVLTPQPGGFDFLHSTAAMVIFSSYIVAYSIRIYIMNYYKNTRPKGLPLDNRAFFGTEQIAASFTMALTATLVVLWRHLLPPWDQVTEFVAAVRNPAPLWGWAAIAGLAFGGVAFFSVFIFMYQGRTATFTGLVNRLTSLVAGTTATLLGYFIFRSRFPSMQNWISLGFVLVAVAFLTRAERKRTRELAAEQRPAPSPA